MQVLLEEDNNDNNNNLFIIILIKCGKIVQLVSVLRCNCNWTSLPIDSWRAPITQKFRKLSKSVPLNLL